MNVRETDVVQSTHRLELVEPEQHAIAVAGPQVGAVVTPGDLLRMAMDRNDGDLDRLERLMAMQERWEQAQERERTRQAVLAFRRGFASFRGENIVIPKTRHVDRGRAGSFDQAEYHVVTGMLSPALSRHGFGFRHDQKFSSRKWSDKGVESDIPWVYVTCYLEHADGHQEVVELEGPPGELTANTPTQNMQVTASYLKRQSLLAITGTATGGEDEEAGLRGADDAGDARGDPERRRGAAAEEPELPTWPDDKFEARMVKWQEAVNAGATHDQIIDFATTKGRLTEAQTQAIRNLEPAVAP
jgi:hypothetical protein